MVPGLLGLFSSCRVGRDATEIPDPIGDFLQSFFFRRFEGILEAVVVKIVTPKERPITAQ